MGMTRITLGAFGFKLGKHHALSHLADELSGDELSTFGRDFDHVLVSEEDEWSAAAAAAKQTLDAAFAQPDLIVVVSQSDPDSAMSGALIADHLGLGSVARIGVSGHDCGNLGPALQVIRDALVTGRASCVLLIVADRASRVPRLMRNGMGFFSDGAAACLAALVEPAGGIAFTPRWSVEEIVVVSTNCKPDGQTDIKDAVALIRSAVNGLNRSQDADSVILAHYRDDARAFLHAATGLRSAVLLTHPEIRSGHIFGADHMLLLADPPPTAHHVVAVALGPWSVSALLLNRFGPSSNPAGADPYPKGSLS